MPAVPSKFHNRAAVCFAGFVGLSTLAGCEASNGEDALDVMARAGSFADGTHVGEVQQFMGRTEDGVALDFYGLVQPGNTLELVVPDGVELERGSTIRVFGDVNDDGKLVIDDLETLAGAPVHNIDAERFAARRIATILVFWESQGLPNGEATQRMYTGDSSTNVFYGENSYGKETIAGEVFGPYQIPDPGGCNTGAISAGAIQALRDHGHNENDYRQLMYQYPSTNCGFAGLASVGSPQQPARDSWYNGSFGCVVRNQEIGHNYGMGHSHAYNCNDGMGNAVPLSDNLENCEHVEYGDPFDPMGGGCGHINVVQKGYMGWFDDCNVVETEMSGTYNLLPTELPCNGTQALRFPMSDGRYFYLEYRRGIGEFDGPSGFEGVIAHVAGEFNQGSPRPYVIDTIGPASNGLLHEGDSFSDPLETVTFTVLEENDTHAVIDVQFANGGSGSPTCVINGEAPEMQAGNVGSLECAVEPYPGDIEAPEVQIVFPEDGAVFEPGSDFNIQAEVTDDRYIFELELYVDGEPMFKIQEEPWEWGVYDIPEGTYEFGIVARDARNWAPSNAVTIHVRDEVPGEETESSSESESDTDAETDSETTGVDPGTTTGVSSGTAGEPEDEVSDEDEDGDTDGAGTNTDDGGCGCTSGSPAGAPASMLMLLGLVWLRRRRD